MTRWIFLVVLILGLAMYAGTINSVQGIGLEVRNKQGGLVSSTGDTSSNTNSFEFGQLAIPIFVTYAILFVFGVMYYKKRIPVIVSKTISTVLDFDISRKISWLIIGTLLIIFIIFGIDKLQHPDDLSWGDYQVVYNYVKNHSINGLQEIFNFRYILHSISLNVFGNIRIIAFAASVSLLLVIYLITSEITKKRFAGIISMVILLQSNLFLKYSVTATYDYFWILFYLLSLYLIYKRWYISPISYAFSLFTKGLTALFLPLTLFFIYRANTKENKKKLFATYIAMFGLLVIYETWIFGFVPHSFHVNEFLTGFHSVGLFLRSDELVILFLLPVIVGLFILSRKGFKQADSLMMLINGFLWFEPLLGGLTDYTNQTYRFIPLVVFFAISVGILFSDRKIQQYQNKNYISNIIFASTFFIVIINISLVIFPALITDSFRVSLD